MIEQFEIFSETGIKQFLSAWVAMTFVPNWTIFLCFCAENGDADSYIQESFI